MTTSSLSRTLVRRWYATLLGLVITVALVGAAMAKVPPSYSASASVLLIPPVNSVGANPYLDLAAVPGVAGVLARTMSDSTIADKLAAKGAPNYKVTEDDTAGGPVVLVTGQGHSADVALTTMKAALAFVPSTLLGLQQAANVSDKALITTTVLTVDTRATAIRKSQTRAAIAAFAAGIFLTVLLAVLADVAARRRRARRVRKQAAGAEQTEQPDEVASVIAEPEADERLPVSIQVERRVAQRRRSVRHLPESAAEPEAGRDRLVTVPDDAPGHDQH